MYVYFIVGGGMTKVGISWDPERRLKDIQRTTATPLRLVRCIEGTHRLEGQFHALLRRRHSHGEWFRGEVSWKGVTRMLAKIEREQPEPWKPPSTKSRRGHPRSRREAIERGLGYWTDNAGRSFPVNPVT